MNKWDAWRTPPPVFADVLFEQFVFPHEPPEGGQRDLVGPQEAFFDAEAIDGRLVGFLLLMKMRQGGVDRFEHLFGGDLASLPFVGPRTAVHRGDTVVLVTVVPGLDRPPEQYPHR